MRFLHGKVKARKGQAINVSFSLPTRVLVMTQKNFEKYKNNLTFTYFGGHKEESPYAFNVPNDGQWFVVVEKGSYYEPTDLIASIELVSGQPPQLDSPGVDEMLDDAASEETAEVGEEEEEED